MKQGKRNALKLNSLDRKKNNTKLGTKQWHRHWHSRLAETGETKRDSKRMKTKQYDFGYWKSENHSRASDKEMKFYDKHISMNKWQGRENLGKQKQTRIGTLKRKTILLTGSKHLQWLCKIGHLTHWGMTGKPKNWQFIKSLFWAVFSFHSRSFTFLEMWIWFEFFFFLELKEKLQKLDKILTQFL